MEQRSLCGQRLRDPRDSQHQVRLFDRHRFRTNRAFFEVYLWRELITRCLKIIVAFSTGMTASTTRFLLEKALSQRLAGNWQDAVSLSEEAFRISTLAADVETIAEAIIAGAHTFREMGESELAAEHYELAEIVARLHDSAGLASRALNGCAIVLQERGDIQEAEAVYAEALRLALTDGDQLTIGNIEMNLGTLHAIRGELETARGFYDACLERYESIGHSRGVLGVLNNLGMLQIDAGRLESATTCLERALELARTSADVLSESTVQLNITQLLIAKGLLDAARSSCDEAFEISCRVGDQSGRSEALKHYGVIYRESGKLYLAETHLRDAIAVASDGGYPLQQAEAHRELALVMRSLGKNQQALESLNQAYGLFSRLQALPQKYEIHERLRQLEHDFLSVVSYWSESIDEKDDYTRGHCQRVASYACLLAERTGLGQDSLTWFRMGALLHDVGKTAIPIGLLNKPSDLSIEERAVVERHTVLGEELLSDIEFPWDIRPMIRSHHERWDGRGYPDGLSGEDIPWSARILRIADVYDALTTTRAYRTMLPPEEALALMATDVGAFDPDLFTVFRDAIIELQSNGTIATVAKQAV